MVNLNVHEDEGNCYFYSLGSRKGKKNDFRASAQACSSSSNRSTASSALKYFFSKNEINDLFGNKMRAKTFA